MTTLADLCAVHCHAQQNLQHLCTWERAALKAPALNTPEFRSGLAAARGIERERSMSFVRGVGAFAAANEPVMHSEPELA